MMGPVLSVRVRTTTWAATPGAQSAVENASDNAGDTGDPGPIPGSGSSPGEGTSNPLQYSRLENSMGRGAWRVTVLEVTNSHLAHARA